MGKDVNIEEKLSNIQRHGVADLADLAVSEVRLKIHFQVAEGLLNCGSNDR